MYVCEPYTMAMAVEALKIAEKKAFSSYEKVFKELSKRMSKKKAESAINTALRFGLLEYKEYGEEGEKETVLSLTPKGRDKLLEIEIKHLKEECAKAGISFDECKTVWAVLQLEGRMKIIVKRVV